MHHISHTVPMITLGRGRPIPMFALGGIMGLRVPALHATFCTIVELVVEITVVQTALDNFKLYGCL